MKRFARGRRGLSTVVTAGILLSAVAVLGSAVVGWSNMNLSTFETALTSTASSDTNKINEFLIIENVWYCKSICPSIPPTNPPAINITLTNPGKIPLNVTDIRLVNSTKSLDFPIQHVAIFPSKSYSWQKTYSWKSQIPINVYVTTARGSIFTTQVPPP